MHQTVTCACVVDDVSSSYDFGLREGCGGIFGVSRPSHPDSLGDEFERSIIVANINFLRGLGNETPSIVCPL